MAAVEPHKGAGPYCLDQRRQDRRIAGAPDEPRAHDHSRQLGRVGREHPLLCQPLGQCVEPQWPQWAWPRLVHVDERRTVHSHQHRLSADVDQAGDTDRTRRRQRVLGALVRLGSDVEHKLAALHAGAQGCDIIQVAAHWFGSETLDDRQCSVGACQRTHCHALATQRQD